MVKPNFNVITIGPANQGKSMLTAAIKEVMCENYNLAEPITYEEMQAVQYNEKGIGFFGKRVEYQSENRQYTHFDFNSDEDMYKTLATGAIVADIAILVSKWDEKDIEKYIKACKIFGIANIVVYNSIIDDCFDEEAYKLLQRDAMVKIENYGYFNVPFILGDSLKAYRNPTSDYNEPILNLMNVLDQFPEPLKAVDKPFLMPIDSVFSIKNRGVIVSGRILSGTVKYGDKVEVIGNGIKKEATVSSIEMMRRIMDEAHAGDLIGMILKDIDKDGLVNRQLITSPGSINQYSNFEAFVYAKTIKERGIQAIFNDDLVNVYLYSDQTLAVISFDKKMLMNGESTEMNIRLLSPQPMEVGKHFVIKKNGVPFAVGIITKVLS